VSSTPDQRLNATFPVSPLAIRLPSKPRFLPWVTRWVPRPPDSATHACGESGPRAGKYSPGCRAAPRASLRPRQRGGSWCPADPERGAQNVIAGVPKATARRHGSRAPRLPPSRRRRPPAGLLGRAPFPPAAPVPCRPIGHGGRLGPHAPKTPLGRASCDALPSVESRLPHRAQVSVRLRRRSIE